jgi:hypothetical protein
MIQNDRNILRGLADRWMNIASQPVMEERRRKWTALKDLRAERPMVIFETASLEGYVGDDELGCEDPELRGVERQMRWTIRHVEEVGDDTIIEPSWNNYWSFAETGYGVEIHASRAIDSENGSQGYAFDHPIRTPGDLERLRPQTWQVDRDGTLLRHERLTDIFGDVMPVILTGTRWLHAGLTSAAFQLIGNENLLMWPYDSPDAMHRLMSFLRDDAISRIAWLEQEGLLELNNNFTHVGSGSPGLTTSLPGPDYSGSAQARDMWVWMESQETTMVSPEMFGEFFLPYMAEIAKKCGLVYYGCCEPVHDRWELIKEAMPNVRAVSVSPWCDMESVAEKFGGDYVFSRKPAASPMSGANPDWAALRQDIDSTLSAARGCNLEFIFRDVYRIAGDRPRLRQWTDMVRSRIEAG